MKNRGETAPRFAKRGVSVFVRTPWLPGTTATICAGREEIRRILIRRDYVIFNGMRFRGVSIGLSFILQLAASGSYRQVTRSLPLNLQKCETTRTAHGQN